MAARLQHTGRCDVQAKQPIPGIPLVMEAATRPEYMELQSRLETFSNWRADAPQGRERLARAGFFYTGDGDCTRCFYCGGALRRWRPLDNEWIEHARFFPKCNYLVQHQGQEFVDAVLSLNMNYYQITIEMVSDALVQCSRQKEGTAETSWTFWEK